MSLQGHVVTTGGGAVIAAENRECLRKGFVIYLDAKPAHLWERLKADTARPLLVQSSNPEATLAQLHQQRDPLYREIAALIVPTGQASVSVVMRAIERGLAEAGVLTP
jgi:shikimate kinase